MLQRSWLCCMQLFLLEQCSNLPKCTGIHFLQPSQRLDYLVLEHYSVLLNATLLRKCSFSFRTQILMLLLYSCGPSVVFSLRPFAILAYFLLNCPCLDPYACAAVHCRDCTVSFIFGWQPTSARPHHFLGPTSNVSGTVLLSVNSHIRPLLTQWHPCWLLHQGVLAIPLWPPFLPSSLRILWTCLCHFSRVSILARPSFCLDGPLPWHQSFLDAFHFFTLCPLGWLSFLLDLPGCALSSLGHP